MEHGCYIAQEKNKQKSKAVPFTTNPSNKAANSNRAINSEFLDDMVSRKKNDFFSAAFATCGAQDGEFLLRGLARISHSIFS